MKMVHETRKMLGDESIQVCPTCVRVPVTNCHSESILVETERKISVDEARQLFAATPGLVVVDDLEKKTLSDAHRLRRARRNLHRPDSRGPFQPQRPGLLVRQRQPPQGRATNAVQIAELLVERSGALRVFAMRRLKLTLAYDGTAYAGWQVSPASTVQATLEATIEKITGRPARSWPAAGRTPASMPWDKSPRFLTESPLAAAVLHRALKPSCPTTSPSGGRDMPGGFHPIRDVVRKRYRYMIHDGPVRDVFHRRYCWHLSMAGSMPRRCTAPRRRWWGPTISAVSRGRRAAERQRSHRFRPRCQAGQGGRRDLVTLEIEADGFLYNMVRPSSALW